MWFPDYAQSSGWERGLRGTAGFPGPLSSWEFPPRRRRRRADAQGTTRGCMRSQNRVQGLSRAKRPSAQWCVSPGWEFGPDRNRRLDTGGAAQSATPFGRLKFSPRSRPNCLRKVTSEGCCSMGAQASRKTAAPTRALCAIRCAFSGSPFGPPNCRAESMLDEMCRDLRALRRRPLQETPSGDPVRRPLQETPSGDPVRGPLQGTPPRYRLLAARNLASQSPGSTTRFPTGYPSIPLCENT